MVGVSQAAFLLLHKGMRERAALMNTKKSFESNGWKGGISKSSLLSPRRRRVLKKSVINLRKQRPKMEDCIRQFNVTMKQIMHVAADIEELETFLLASAEQTLPSGKYEVIHLAAMFGNESVPLERGLSNWKNNFQVQSSVNEVNENVKTGTGKDDPDSDSSTDASCDSESYADSDCPKFSAEDCEQNDMW